MIHLLTCAMYAQEELPLNEFIIGAWYELLCAYASPLVSWWHGGWGG